MNVIVVMEVVITLVSMRLDHFIVNVTLAIHLMIMDLDVQVHAYSAIKTFYQRTLFYIVQLL